MNEHHDNRSKLFASSHPGVKPPHRSAPGDSGNHLVARSLGYCGTKVACCRPDRCRDTRCPARDLHNLAEIADLLKEHPPIIDAPCTLEKPKQSRAPRRKLVKKCPQVRNPSHISSGVDLGVPSTKMEQIMGAGQDCCFLQAPLSKPETSHPSLPARSRSKNESAQLCGAITKGPWFACTSATPCGAIGCDRPTSRYTVREASDLTKALTTAVCHSISSTSQSDSVPSSVEPSCVDGGSSIRSISSEAVGRHSRVSTSMVKKVKGVQQPEAQVNIHKLAGERLMLSNKTALRRSLREESPFERPTLLTPLKEVRSAVEGGSYTNFTVFAVDETPRDDSGYPGRYKMLSDIRRSIVSITSLQQTYQGQFDWKRMEDDRRHVPIPISKAEDPLCLVMPVKPSIRVVDKTPVTTPNLPRTSSIRLRKERTIARKLRDLHAVSGVSQVIGSITSKHAATFANDLSVADNFPTTPKKQKSLDLSRYPILKLIIDQTPSEIYLQHGSPTCDAAVNDLRRGRSANHVASHPGVPPSHLALAPSIALSQTSVLNPAIPSTSSRPNRIRDAGSAESAILATQRLRELIPELQPSPLFVSRENPPQRGKRILDRKSLHPPPAEPLPPPQRSSAQPPYRDSASSSSVLSVLQPPQPSAHIFSAIEARFEAFAEEILMLRQEKEQAERKIQQLTRALSTTVRGDRSRGAGRHRAAGKEEPLDLEEVIDDYKDVEDVEDDDDDLVRGRTRYRVF